MLNIWKVLILLALLGLLQNFHVAAYNILAIVTLPLKSHYMAFDRFFRELAKKGHHVTVINNYIEEPPPENMTYIDLSYKRERKIVMPLVSDFDSLGPHYARWINFHRHYESSPASTIEDCENLLQNEFVKEFLTKKYQYDVIFVEQFMCDCGLAFAAAYFNAPIIGFTSHTLLPWSYSRLGLPFDFSSEAFYFSNAGVHPNLFYKIESFLAYLLMKSVEKSTLRIIENVFKKHAPEVNLHMEDVTKNMKMMFVYQHYSVTGARIMSPQILEVGGLHIDKQKPIPKNIEDFLSSAEHGAIFFSFGSNLNADTMSPYKKQQFLDAFNKLPYKIIWKIENITLPAGNNNKILTSPWLPQRDILCHPKVIGFISHGGMLSLSEAAHCATPLITMPFFGDQYSNVAAIEDAGLGVTLSFDQVTSDLLVDAIQRITSPKMQKMVKKIHDLWHDRPMNVLDSAIYWTEYVARHRDAPPSPPTKQPTWFQKSLIDVYSVLLATATA
ncbi:UDP-glycosyltransferase UGT5-like isoform X2 [Leptidea sinapis]|uniref:UDP-glycosyltransferase UGT5-like isoform X2 n=1 Tax=Leptidea sinapis TaxID=189913 RepID=UPI00213C5F00|nr:UDP-glycosyltransferase UGT5-like isoform X2 [Leptidea sinapis]